MWWRCVEVRIWRRTPRPEWSLSSRRSPRRTPLNLRDKHQVFIAAAIFGLCFRQVLAWCYLLSLIMACRIMFSRPSIMVTCKTSNDVQIIVYDVLSNDLAVLGQCFLSILFSLNDVWMKISVDVVFLLLMFWTVDYILWYVFSDVLIWMLFRIRCFVREVLNGVLDDMSWKMFGILF